MSTVNGYRSTPRKGRGDVRLGGVSTPPIMDIDLPKEEGESDEYIETWLKLVDLQKGHQNGNEDVEIEELIIRELLQRHSRWMEAGTG